MAFITVIVHYNAPIECADFVIDLVNSVEQHPIVIVDNNSENKNIEILKHRLKNINAEILELNENNGFGAGINYGVKYGQRYNPNFIHIINTDVKLINPNYIKDLINILEKKPIISIVGPTVYKNTKKEIQNTILPFPSLKKAILFKNIANQSYDSDKIEITETDAINGVCFIVRNKHFIEVNGFTESYFMYGEEQDLAFKILKKGYKSAYITIPSIIHYGADIPQKKVIDWKFMAVRVNQIRFISIHKSKFEAILLSFYFLFTIIQKRVSGYNYVNESFWKIVKSFFHTIYYPKRNFYM